MGVDEYGYGLCFTKDEEIAYLVTMNVIAFFSILGSGLLVLTFIFFPKMRKYSFRMVLYLSISDIIYSISWFLQQKLVPGLCVFSAVLQFFGSWQTMLWSDAITLNLLLITQFEIRLSGLKTLEKYWLVAVYVIPIVGIIVLAVEQEFQPACFGCWIRNRFLRFGLVEIEVIISWAFVFVSYVLILRKLRKVDTLTAELREGNERQSLELHVQRKMRWFLLAFLVSWTPSLLIDIGFLISATFAETFYIWYWFFAILTPMQGFLNAIAYGRTVPEVRRGWLLLIRTKILRKPIPDPSSNEKEVPPKAFNTPVTSKMTETQSGGRIPPTAEPL